MAAQALSPASLFLAMAAVSSAVFVSTAALIRLCVPAVARRISPPSHTVRTNRSRKVVDPTEAVVTIDAIMK